MTFKTRRKMKKTNVGLVNSGPGVGWVQVAGVGTVTCLLDTMNDY